MKKNKVILLFSLTFLLICMPERAYGMHIMEGFLPPGWCISWGMLALPFVIFGFLAIQKIANESPRLKLLLAMAGAFVFLLSAMKIPSVTGSCSHPTGTGLGTILFGPAVMSVLGTIVLLFQAILLGHGGLTTLGANAFSMAVFGPLAAYGIYQLAHKMKVSRGVSVFLAAALGDLATYVMTSIQLALAFPDPSGGLMASLMKFMSIFAVTQIPLAISEGILTVIIFNAIAAYGKGEFQYLKVFSKEVI